MIFSSWAARSGLAALMLATGGEEGLTALSGRGAHDLLEHGVLLLGGLGHLLLFGLFLLHRSHLLLSFGFH